MYFKCYFYHVFSQHRAAKFLQTCTWQMLKFDALALAKRSCAHTSVRWTRSSGLRTTQAHTRSRLSLLFMRFLHFNIENRLIYQDRFTSNQNCLYLSDIIFSNCLQERLLAGGTITWMTRPSRNIFKGRTRSPRLQRNPTLASSWAGVFERHGSVPRVYLRESR